ncbi:o-succinylbenzoate--CoA ligase [Cronobacter sakazakii]|uniref:o-succinylbenzoate--CoA ligase n=1 Tax=Cronobacter sakazakii TaxID=28141 RepID=UPI000A15B394|nr:o-succinylbenzoate--CoA ligase [Cronobacter sakazakii]PUV73012.1 o-succinylbenzoate--CoA ligase [Cronobacter sakazakii]PUV99000.1 o-succinylbenzoate--CoA ligase [Cronobacter sakazakii]
MSLFDWPWRHWASMRPHDIALRADSVDITWRALCKRIDALAAGFHQQGVRDGDGVAVCAKNSERTLLAWLALLQCGARILPLNPQLPAPLINALLPSLTLRYAVCIGDAPALPGLTLLDWREPAAAYAAAWQADRLVSMTLTSGSSGLPKAAVHTAFAHLESARGVLSLIPFHAADCWLLSLPLFHVSGQGIFWRWLRAGAQLAVRDSLPLYEALEGCTHASLVPTQLWRLLAMPVCRLSLKAVLLGGAAIPVALTQAAAQREIACWCGYGLTEFASTVCAKRADGEADVGVPLPGREVMLAGDEIWLRGTSMAAGYWRDGALVPLTNAQGWFATRDRGAWRDGKLLVPGRLDNLFFCGGEGVQPEAVERVLSQHPQVRQALVVPLEDDEFGARPVAVIECEASFEPQALRLWASDKLARFEQPVAWLRLPETLKNGGIKISRRALRDWVNQQAIADSGTLDIH